MPDTLFPTFVMPQTVAQRQQAQATPEYRPSYSFNFAVGDFQIDGAGRIPRSDGYSAWAAWCVKTILCQRFAHLIYSRRYGVDLDGVLKQPSRAAVQASLQQEIAAALRQHPGTKSASDFTFTWSGDQLTVGVTITPTVGTAQRLEVPVLT